ncbi:MAG: phosphate ABC transporter permease subunit PstC [Prochlorothrix sp.]
MTGEITPQSPNPRPTDLGLLWQPNRTLHKRVEKTVQTVFASFALISVATTIGIVAALMYETVEFFKEVPLWDFLTQTRWTPLFGSAQFGIMVLISATFRTSAISMLVAVPLGMLAAICLSEYASPRLRGILKPLLEILAGIPTVVFGYFALLFLTPLLQNFIPPLQGFNSLSAGLVLGIAITPLVASLSEDAIYAVPQSLRDGSYALGATKRETIISVVLPAALSGIVSSLILATSRAIGETMIVTLAAGQTANLGLNPFVPVMTMTAFIVEVSKGDVEVASIGFKTLFAVGMTLFIITLVLNIFSFWFVRRFREKYE